MGMFDYIRCEAQLPKAPTSPNCKLFQTKDTPDQQLTVYTITSDGKLSWRPYHTETVPKAERPYPDKDGILGMCGMWRRVEQEPEDIDYHGDIEFYHFCEETETWWEYRARFNEGSLASITLIDYSILANPTGDKP